MLPNFRQLPILTGTFVLLIVRSLLFEECGFFLYGNCCYKHVETHSMVWNMTRPNEHPHVLWGACVEPLLGGVDQCCVSVSVSSADSPQVVSLQSLFPALSLCLRLCSGCVIRCIPFTIQPHADILLLSLAVLVLNSAVWCQFVHGIYSPGHTCSLIELSALRVSPCFSPLRLAASALCPLDSCIPTFGWNKLSPFIYRK